MTKQGAFEVNGYALREIRTRSNLSVTELARNSDIDQGFLSHLEAGRRRYMRPPTFGRLLAALGLKDRRAILANPHACDRIEDDSEDAA
jgi:transcriptional regulator with XRE-family HTH domain